MAVPTSGTAVVSTPTDEQILITREFDAPRHLVFRAYTEPDLVSRWWPGRRGEMQVCEIDLRPGGAWHFVWRKSDGTEMAMRGVYQEIVSPERLVSTESWGGDWPETLNTLLLSEQDGRTTITSRVLYVSKEARDAALKTGMQDGMSQTYDRLAEYLATLA